MRLVAVQRQQWHVGAPVSTSLRQLAVLWGVYIAIPLAIGIPALRKLCANPAEWGKR